MERRTFLKSGGMAPLMMGGHAAGAIAPPGLGVAGLSAEWLSNPMGLEQSHPRLAWRLEADGPDVRQTAYRLLAAARREDLVMRRALLWDSGRIASDRTIDIPYGGAPLAPRQRIWWCVEVWDNRGHHAQSEAAWFEGALAPDRPWQAQWIEAETDEARADRLAGPGWIWSARALDDRPHGFRLGFEVGAGLVRADLLVAGKDHLRGVWVNGAEVAPDRPKVGHRDPFYWGSMTHFAAPLKAGRNVLAIEVAADTSGFFPVDGGAMAALIRLHYADGRVERLVSGPLWRVMPDAPKGWTAPDFDDGQWAAAVPSGSAAQGDPRESEPAIQMRRSFHLDKPVARARLYATALGAYQCRLNGKRTDDAVLAPEISVARDHLFYQTHDVTALLRPGENVLAALVGSGWYGGAFGWRMERYGFGPAPRRFVAQLVIDHADGTTTTIGTGPEWVWQISPVLASEIYHGETYDARRQTAGWDAPGHDAGQWSAARVGRAPDVRLIPQVSPPIREVETRTPVAVRPMEAGCAVVDFGQNLSGWVRLKLRGEAGRQITLRFAEVLAADGHVDMRNLRGADATDRYTMAGGGEEIWEPVFTYHGFRYVQIEGLAGPLPPDALCAVVVGSDCPETGRMTFARSPLLQWIWNNARWSQKSNFFAVPTDCPQRDERMGWMGDIQVFLDAAAFNMDVDGFIRRFLVEVRAAQRKDGAYPIVVPQPLSFPDVVTAGWSEAGIILPYLLWQRYGDTRVIEDNWAAMTRWMDYVARHSTGDLWESGRGLDLGDWLSVDAVKPDDETTPRALCASAYYARVADLMAAMAQALGRAELERGYRALRRRIGAAFARRFVGGDGTIGNGSQASHALALQFGLVPQDLRAPAARHLAADIRHRGMKLSTGFLGTPCLLDALADHGHWDVVAALLTQTGYPGWGYMPARGATTVWERWNGDTGDLSMNSYNHYAFGAVVGFFYRRLAGIAPGAPGFARIVAAPRYLHAIGPVEAEYQAMSGRIATRVEGDAWGMARFCLTVPANVTAQVILPQGRWRFGGGMVEARDGGGAAEVGSGRHIFVRGG